MRDERNVYGTFKFFVKYRLGQQFRWRVFWFNLSGKLFAGYRHSKRSQIEPNIVDICSELWGKVSHFRIGYSFAAIFFRKFQWLNFMHGSIACPSIWWQILRRDLWETRQPAQKKSFGLISWQVGWWLQKLAKHRGISSTFYTFYKARHFCQVRKTSQTYSPWPEIGSWNFT